MNENIAMSNQTIVKEFFLSGLSNLPALQLPLFSIFLLIYLLTIIWNSLIILLIVSDSHLHTPMYFFLGNLAGLDLCCSSVTVPQMLLDLHTKERKITVTACITQVFFFLFFTTSEALLLSVMSYDRYTAICKPLHYMQLMHWKKCLRLVSIVWCLGLTNAFVNTLYALHLRFCASGVIESFFCDLPQLFQISCSDIFINIVLLFLLSSILGLGSLTVTFLPYIYIFKTVLKMEAKKTGKVFSTCISHLTVVLIFYFSITFNYFRPNTNNHFAADKVVSIFYTMIIPLLNPLIYSLRNQDFRTAFESFFRKIFQAKYETRLR